MKLSTILTGISSMVIGFQGALAAPLTPGLFAKRGPWIPCWDGNSQIECKTKRQAGMDPAPPPAPTNVGASSSCARWYTIATKDEGACRAALADGLITLAEFRSLNPFVNESCTNLWVGYSYCIGKATSTKTGSPTLGDGSAFPPPTSSPPGSAPVAPSIPSLSTISSSPSTSSPSATSSSDSAPPASATQSTNLTTASDSALPASAPSASPPPASTPPAAASAASTAPGPTPTGSDPPAPAPAPAPTNSSSPTSAPGASASPASVSPMASLSTTTETVSADWIFTTVTLPGMQPAVRVTQYYRPISTTTPTKRK